MANLPNLEKAKLESEAYGKMIRDMINALNSDLVDLKVKDDRIKLIPEKKDAPVREMFGTAMSTIKRNQEFMQGLADTNPNIMSKRIGNRLAAFKKEREKFMYRYKLQRSDKRDG